MPSLKSRVSVPSIATIECVRRRLSTPGLHHRASSTSSHASTTRKPIQVLPHSPHYTARPMVPHNTYPTPQTHPVTPLKLSLQLDWVTTEDGAHILTIASGTTIALYTSVSSEVSKGIRREDAYIAAQIAANAVCNIFY